MKHSTRRRQFTKEWPGFINILMSWMLLHLSALSLSNDINPQLPSCYIYKYITCSYIITTVSNKNNVHMTEL